MKNVSSETLRVHAHQRRSGVNVPHDQGSGFLDAAVSIRTGFEAKAMDAELAPARGEIRGCELLNCVVAHILIIAAGRGDASDAGAGLTPCLERENGILLGRNGASVVSGRAKVPVFQRRETLVIDRGAEALQHRLADDLFSFVDRDFDDDFALGVRTFPRVDDRIGRCDGQSWTNLVAIYGSAGQAPVGESYGSAVAQL